MTPEEYTRKKVEIVKKHTGEILVPENQIIDLPVTKYMVEAMKTYVTVYDKGYLLQTLNGDACVYCAEYYNVEDNTCYDCPMHEAGNDCGDSGSSYDVCTDALANADESKLIEELIELAREFINANKEK